jgi:hypothetical protein
MVLGRPSLYSCTHKAVCGGCGLLWWFGWLGRFIECAHAFASPCAVRDHTSDLPLSGCEVAMRRNLS